MGVLEAVIAGLIVAAVSGGGSYAWGTRNTERKYRQRYAAAIDEFAKELREMINGVDPRADDAVTRARSIVAVRNSLRQTLTTLAGSLNSNIDHLEELVGDGNTPVENEGAVRERLAVLKQAWPAKDAEIRVAVRKILAELGFEPE